MVELDAGGSLDLGVTELEHERLLVRLRAGREPHGECSAGDDPTACAARLADVDARIGELLALLDERGTLAATHVVVTATHGSERRVDGYGVADRAVRVPLVVAGPGVHTGAVVPHAVGWVDLLPTLAHLLDRPHPDRSAGTSLVPWLVGDGDSPRDVLLWNDRAERELGLPLVEAVAWERWKYVRVHGGGEALYDLVADPLEASDVAGGEPVALVQGRRRLELAARDLWELRPPRASMFVFCGTQALEAYASRAESGLPRLPEGRPVFDTELTYSFGPGLSELDPDAPVPEPLDPRAHAATVDAFLRARDLLEAGDAVGARPYVEAVERAVPDSVPVERLRGLELELDDRTDDAALHHYRLAAVRDPWRASTWSARARIHRRRGELAHWLWNARVAEELDSSAGSNVRDARAAIRKRAQELHDSGRRAEATRLRRVLDVDLQIRRTSHGSFLDDPPVSD